MTDTLAHDLPGMAMAAALFSLLLLSAEFWKRRGGAPEHTRKLVHLLGGLACLPFPFWFRSAWSVAVLALSLALLFVVGKRLGFLKSLHGVSRRTAGSEYYPPVICLLFLVTRDAPAFYVCAVLVLAIGDAGAALIGMRYGTVRYEVEDEQKSVEGSLAFATLAFLAIHLPLLLMTALPRPVCVLAAALVAVLVTGFEAIALRGSDNLFVPLGVAVILSKITTKPVAEIIFQTASLALICAGMLVVARRARCFNAGGTIAAILFAYGAWSLGSWAWALPIFICFGTIALLWRLASARDVPRPTIKVLTVFHAAAFPLVALLVANMLKQVTLLYAPFVAMLAVVLALAMRSLWPPPGAGRGAAAAAALRGALSGLLVLVPAACAARGSVASVATLAALAAAAAAAGDAGRGARAAPGGGWTASRVALTLLAGLAAVGLELTRALAPWSPP